MLDMRWLRDHADAAREGYRRKHVDPPLDRVLALDVERRRLLQEVEALRAERNRASEEVARLKKAGHDAAAVIASTTAVGRRLAEQERILADVEAELETLSLELPNVPDDDVPIGADEGDNVPVQVVGAPRPDSPEVMPHWDFGPALGLVDFERAHKLSGTRFSMLTGFGATLSRGLVNLMLSEAARAGYQEMAPPYLVRADAMVGTGQFPKFVEDVFRVEPGPMYLIPTAEVPLTNYRSGEILDLNELPVKYCAYTACFRSEAGAAGRDTRGLIRQHQFDKVELVMLTRPEDARASLDTMTRDAAHILDLLELPYRIMEHCGGDLGFSHRKGYDLEVWMPS
ncbi:MAG: serine--tRNA ligase, partial [Clostridia bacterium]